MKIKKIISLVIAVALISTSTSALALNAPREENSNWNVDRINEFIATVA